MKKKAYFLKKMIHILGLVLSFLLISQIPSEHSILKVSLYMAVGTFWLIDLLQIFFTDNYSNLGLYVNIILGSGLLLMFGLWLGNTILKLMNPIFVALNWDFQIGNLFSGIYQYLFSVPSLICGLVLIVVALIWDNSVAFRIWELAIKYEPEKRLKTKRSEI